MKPEYDAGENLKEQMDAVVALYEEECSLRSIADALTLNPIKVRKLLITAGVYESEVAEKVQDTFEEYRETQNYKEAILSTANTLQLSKAPLPRTYHIKKVCTSRVQQIKKKLVLEQSGGGDTEQ